MAADGTAAPQLDLGLLSVIRDLGTTDTFQLDQTLRELARTSGDFSLMGFSSSPWYGRREELRALENAGLLDIDPGTAEMVPHGVPSPSTDVFFLQVTAAGLAALGVDTSLSAAARAIVEWRAAQAAPAPITIWNDGQHWGWGPEGDVQPPAKAVVILDTWPFPSGLTIPTDPAGIEGQARELEAWLRGLAQ